MIAFAIIKSQPGRSLLIILLSVFFLPLLFSYTNIYETLKHYNLCFVGPQQPGQSSPLYGTYRAFDGASYYFLKTPFDVSHNTCLLPKCGWPDATMINNIMSPYAMKRKKKDWKIPVLEQQLVEDGDMMMMTMEQQQQQQKKGGAAAAGGGGELSSHTASSIYWDQSHSVTSTGYSRWCLHSTELPFASSSSSSSSVEIETESPRPPKSLSTYCSEPVPSVLADANKKPYFPELPLNPPPRGSWGENVRVECFVDGSMGGLKDYTFSSQRKHHGWNLWKLPGTLILMVVHGYGYLKYSSAGIGGGDNCGTMSDVDGGGDIWTLFTGAFVNVNGAQLGWTLWNLWIVGAVMEEDYGSLTYVYLHIAIVTLIGGLSIGMVWLCRRWGWKLVTDNDVFIFGYSATVLAWIVVIQCERDSFPLVPYTDVHVMLVGRNHAVPILINAILAFLCLPRTISIDLLDCKINVILSHVVSIVVGFMLHFNIPPRSVLAPHVLVTSVVYLQLVYLKKVTLLRNETDITTTTPTYETLATADHGAGTTAAAVAAAAAAQTDEEQQPCTTPPHLNLKLRILLDVLRFGHILISFVGIVALDHAMALAGIAVSILFFIGIGRYFTQGVTPDTDAILRGYFVSTIILIVAEGMSVGSWLASHIFILSNPHTLFAGWDMMAFSSCRMILNGMGIVVAAKILETKDDQVELFGTVFVHCRIVGEALWSVLVTKELEREDGEGVEMNRRVRGPPQQIMV